MPDRRGWAKKEETGLKAEGNEQAQVTQGVQTTQGAQTTQGEIRPVPEQRLAGLEVSDEESRVGEVTGGQAGHLKDWDTSICFLTSFREGQSLP